MQIFILLAGIYIGQEFKDLPNIKNICISIYTLYNGTNNNNIKI